MDMKIIQAALICMSFIIIFPQSSLCFLDVGGDYGVSWLNEHGKEPKVEEVHNNLWNWGNAPKGFAIYNGTVYPPGYAPVWYNPDYFIESTPIFINNSALSNQHPVDNEGLGPWLTAQLSGRPVAMFQSSPG